MIDKKSKDSILDTNDKMLKEIRCLLGLVGTGLKIANKEKNYIFLIRLGNCQDLLGLSQASIKLVMRIIKEDANKKDAKKAVMELLAVATEHLELAKFNYACYLEIRKNPDRSAEEIMEAASKRTESLYI